MYSAAGAASDLSSVYVASGGIYAPSADVYVRPAPAYRQPPYAEPGYGYRQPSYETPGPAYRAPASVYGEYGPAPAQPAYVERAPVYPERHYARERRYAPDRYYGQERDYAGNATMHRNTRRGRPCPCPTVRARDATTAMAGGSPAIKHAGWVERKRCPSCALRLQRHDVRRTVGRISDSVIRRPTGNTVDYAVANPPYGLDDLSSPIPPKMFTASWGIIGLTSVDDRHFFPKLIIC